MRSQVVSWAFTGLALAFTAGRIWIRAKIIRKLDWDDLAHSLGFAFLLTQVAIVSRATTMMYNLNVGQGNSKEITYFFRLDIAATLITWCCLYSIKAAFLLLYRRIFQVSVWFTRAWWAVSIIVFLSFWELIAASITQCGSPSQIDRIGIILQPSITENISLTGCRKLHHPSNGPPPEGLRHV